MRGFSNRERCKGFEAQGRYYYLRAKEVKRDYKRILRICSKIMFGVYIMCLAYFLFFAESAGRTFEGRTYHYNLELFKEIRRFIVHRRTLGFWAVMLNLVGNVVAFFPFGFFLPVLYPKCRSFLYTVFFSFECSLLVETIQLVSKVGSFDVDDMLLNTIGGAIGCLVFFWMDRVRRAYETKEKG